MANTSIRETVLNAINHTLAHEAAYKAHESNYSTLYVDRDGRTWWSEEVDSNTLLIDPKGDSQYGIATVPYLTQVGTGSCRCNCDYCSEIGDCLSKDGTEVVSADDEDAGEEITADMAIGNAVSDGDTDAEPLIDGLDDIPVGYFADEEVAA